MTDYEICKKLINDVFDPEREIESKIVANVEAYCEKERANQPEKKWDQWKLDMLLLYLRRVHAYCLYCGEEHEDERMLSTRCGPQHIRHHEKIKEEEF